MHTDFFRNIHKIIGESHRMNLAQGGNQAGGISRRGFVQGVAASAALVSVPHVALASGKSVPKIAIIGGGLAGLNAAYQLKKLGLSATVYEASSRIGGRVLTVRSALAEGLVTEMGAELVNSDHTDIHALAKDFGIGMFLRKTSDVRKISAVSYYLDGRTWSEKELAQAMQPLVKVIAEDSARVEEDDAYAAQIDSLSVSDYLDRNAGQIKHKAVRQLLEDSIRVEYGVEPHESSALQLIYNLPAVKDGKFDILSESDEAYAVEGGTDGITRGLAAALGGRIKTRMKLARVSRGKKGGYDLGFANGKKVKADFVILAIPFSVLRNVRMDVELPNELKAFIQEAKLGRNEKVIAGFHERVWQSPQGFSSEAWADRNFLEVWDSSARQPNLKAGSLTFFLGGDSAIQAGQKTVAQSGKEAVRTLAPFINGLAQADAGVYMRTSWGSSAYLKGSYSNYAPGQLTRFAPYLWIESENSDEAQEVRVENLYFAGEHLSDSSYGFMNGAAETGRLAAYSLAKSVISSAMVQKN